MVCKPDKRISGCADQCWACRLLPAVYREPASQASQALELLVKADQASALGRVAAEDLEAEVVVEDSEAEVVAADSAEDAVAEVSAVLVASVGIDLEGMGDSSAIARIVDARVFMATSRSNGKAPIPMPSLFP
jgi:hypothetical protein